MFIEIDEDTIAHVIKGMGETIQNQKDEISNLHSSIRKHSYEVDEAKEEAKRWEEKYDRDIGQPQPAPQPVQTRSFGGTFDELMEAMNWEWASTHKINLIKLMRAITGQGLKETKDFVEQKWLPYLEQLHAIKKAAEEERMVDMEKAKQEANKIFNS